MNYKAIFNPLSGTFDLVNDEGLVFFKPAVATASALPTTGNLVNDSRITTDTGHLYIWNGTEWLDQGDIIDITWDTIIGKPTSTPSNIDDAVSKRHTQGTDTTLGAMTADLDMNDHSIINVKDDSITFKSGGSITKANYESLVSDKHTHANKTDLDAVSGVNTGDQDLSGKEDVANKSTDVELGESDTLYPTQKAVKTYADTQARLDLEEALTDANLNIILNAFRIAQTSSFTAYSMIKGYVDEYRDESHIDLPNCYQERYNADEEYYTLASGGVDEYVVLLLHCNGTNGSTTFTDETGKTMTANGDAQISTAQYKFGTGSGLFDGTGDYVSTVDHDDWEFGTGDFTVDLWFRRNGTGSGAFLAQELDDNNKQTFGITGADNNLSMFSKSGGNLIGYYITSTNPIQDSGWHHVAFVRSGTNAYIFYDGVSQALTVYNNWGVSALPNISAPLKIGYGEFNYGYFDGYLDEIRISKGIARWTSNFTPPVTEYEELETLAYTLSLGLHMDGENESTEIIDEAGHTFTVVGDCELRTAIKKMGTASLYIAPKPIGDYNYISAPDSDSWDFGLEDFTIDFWVYMDNKPPSYGRHYFISSWGFGFVGWSVSAYEQGMAYFTFGASGSSTVLNMAVPGGDYLLQTWYHLAITRQGDNLYGFINGVLTASASGWASININSTGNGLRIGLYEGAPSTAFTGYIDEVRILKGIALWTTSFTPPTEEFEYSITSMRLQSQAESIDIVPTTARIVIFEEDVDAIIENVDLQAYISRDDGTTFKRVVLEDEGNYIPTARVLSGVVDLSTLPSGQDVVYKIETKTNKTCKLHGTAVSWK